MQTIRVKTQAGNTAVIDQKVRPTAKKNLKQYQGLILKVVIILLIVWALFFQVIGFTHMPNEDMQPRVDAGDLLLFYRLDKKVQAQDVIVIEKAIAQNGGEKELFVCRVVAKGGDTVAISDDNRLIVNGNTVAEHNIYYSTPAYEGYVEYPLTLGADECFVLADYREEGVDSRYFGPVKKSEIVGTVITILRRNHL